MIVNGAEIILVWSNGKRYKLGTLDIEANDAAETKANAKIRFLRQKIGWSLVRMGFWMMFPWRKWKAGDVNATD